MSDIEQIKLRLQELELENELLKSKLEARAETRIESERSASPLIDSLSLDEYRRYGRQMIVPEFGSLDSQIKLKSSSVLVIGAGGLGCPALLYIAASGVGNIGIVDSDEVDVSNLHRQVLHTTESVGIPKVESAKRYINKLNPHVKVETYVTMITNDNAFDIVSKYDLILDCTDNPATRYLINDVCVLSNKPIISGSGLKTEGQLSILNYGDKGPCYRCFYPQPPSPNSVTSCKDGGVLGPCIGLIGVTMAVETIKILTNYYEDGKGFSPFLSMYSSYPQQQIRVFKMRSKQKTCSVCGDSPVITREMIVSNQIDYVEFCGKLDSNVLQENERISVKEYNTIHNGKACNSILIDVRPKEQFSIVSLPNSVHIPWDPIINKADNIDEYLPPNTSKEDQIFVICRYGNDSQLATRKLLKLGYKNVKDVKGGLNKWSEVIDSKFPVY